MSTEKTIRFYFEQASQLVLWIFFCWLLVVRVLDPIVTFFVYQLLRWWAS